MFMMKRKALLCLPVCLSTLVSMHSLANNQDARSFAMGGVGVSTSNFLTSSLHNPALAAKFDNSDDIGFLFPSFAANVNNIADTVDNIENFSDVYDEFKSIATPTLDDAQKVVDELYSLQGDPASINAGSQIALAIPNDIVAVNLYAQAYVDAMVFADIADTDLEADNILNQDLNSNALTMGVLVSEFGVTLAKYHQFDNSTLYYGLTPKYQTVDTINFVSNIDNVDFDDWDNDSYQNSEGNMNVDLGIAYQHQNGFGLGLAAKNLLKQSYETESISGVQGHYEITPVYTLGGHYESSFVIAALDIQLNESEGYSKVTGINTNFNSDNDNRQFASLGVEFVPMNWIKLRAGYRSDLSDNIDDSITAGIGFSVVNIFHIDLSGSYSDNNNMGAAAQTSFTF
ncbi:hypothetical protein CW745_01785 [Psychromonas sp. psych-6C06]|uniref:conjugal transfer protein TraF n=1 Tax=Psychromonas sp. psych-6C06 TaxID=2058089 RepID=UPI000C324EE4|nr:conjugal transfer protein TraF [Psychromonas sp. psych-6C06]PKF63602.1 hypothetical protein CW745_01785 [Psychromonas sp. psych-6C06]